MCPARYSVLGRRPKSSTKVWASTEPIEFSDALASGSVTGILSAVEAHSSLHGVMLVGHEPTLSELISTMASGTYQTALNLKPGGLCKLNVTAIRLGQCATIEWFVTPKQLVAMS